MKHIIKTTILFFFFITLVYARKGSVGDNLQKLIADYPDGKMINNPTGGFTYVVDQDTLNCKMSFSLDERFNCTKLAIFPLDEQSRVALKSNFDTSWKIIDERHWSRVTDSNAPEICTMMISKDFGSVFLIEPSN